MWDYKINENWKETICHSFLFPDRVPHDLMKRITTMVCDKVSKTENMRCLEVNQIYSWQKTLILSTILSVGAKHTIEILVHLAEKDSKLCVASKSMSIGMTRLVICAKGPAMHIWNGGYGIVRGSVDRVLLDCYGCMNYIEQEICPHCLQDIPIGQACVWKWSDFKRATQEGYGSIWCNKGHKLNERAISLICNKKFPSNAYPDKIYDSKIDITDHLHGVVLVGLYNAVNRRITELGSGFIVDKKRGLILTAAHLLMEIEEKKSWGKCKEGKVVIGVIPKTGNNNETKAVFRYFAKIVAKDKLINSKEKRCEIDACVLQITTRMKCDVDGSGDECGKQEECVIVSNPSAMWKEDLKELQIAERDCEINESVYSIGFSQGGSGVQTEIVDINRNYDVIKGYVSSGKIVSNARKVPSSFSPRTEIVVNCYCVPGHSGSACINKEGKVIGIVSRIYPGETGRCYLVPWQNLKALVKRSVF